MPFGWSTVVKLGVGVVILVWFLLGIDTRQLLQLVSILRLEFVPALVLLSVLRIWISAYRFRRLAESVTRIDIPDLVKQ